MNPVLDEAALLLPLGLAFAAIAYVSNVQGICALDESTAAAQMLVGLPCLFASFYGIARCAVNPVSVGRRWLRAALVVSAMAVYSTILFGIPSLLFMEFLLCLPT